MAVGTVILAGTIFAGIASAVVFWEKVVEFAQAVVFPFFKKHLPSIEPYVRKAFVVLNKVAMAARRAAIAAWEKVRPHILKVSEKWERTSDNEYVLKVTSWLREKLSDDEVTRTVSEEKVAMDDLPPDVMEAFLETNTRSEEIDVTEQQDRQVQKAKREMSAAT